MIAFPVVGEVVKKSGWRPAWAGIGIALLVSLAPLAVFFVRTPPPDLAAVGEGTPEEEADPRAGYTLFQALATPAFWVMGLASAVYGLIASGIGLFNESILRERGFTYETYYNNFLVVTALTSLVVFYNYLGSKEAAERAHDLFSPRVRDPPALVGSSSGAHSQVRAASDHVGS